MLMACRSSHHPMQPALAFKYAKTSALLWCDAHAPAAEQDKAHFLHARDRYMVKIVLAIVA